MIDRNIEKSLHLLRMEIHRQDAMNTGCHQEIGYELGRYRNTRFIFSILSCVSKKRDHRGDAISAGSSRRIHHDEQLHQMIVSRWTGRLNNKNIAPTNVLLDFDVGLAVGKCANRGLAERHSNVITNAPGQVAVGRAAEYLHLRLKCEHRRAQDYA